MKWISYGENAILVRFAEKPGEWAYQKCRNLARALEESAPPSVSEFVPGYTSLLVEFELRNAEELSGAAEELMRVLRKAINRKAPLGPIKEIPVRYEGVDLERVALHNKISTEQVIKYHSGPLYKVYLLGFAPGFPYLGDLHHKLVTPRLEHPRRRVEPGSVGIGGNQTGIYTVPSPGGWNIIGQTDMRIFDPTQQREDAFFLRQGDRVRFVPV